MPAYQYRARDKFGKPISGVMAAETESALVFKLNQLGYVPIDITATEEKGGSLFDAWHRVRFSDLNMFTRQFATLQRAGLPVLLSLSALKEQAANTALEGIISGISRDIESGESLTEALGKYPRVFGPLYINMISAGETAGTLSDTLERLAVLGENDEKIRLRVKTATRYPIIVIIALTIGFFILTTFVVPRFAQIYSKFTTQLPLPTRILLWINFAVTKFWWLSILAIAALSFAFNRFINTKPGRAWWDNLKLRVPVFGPLVLKLSMSRFSRITATLLESGVPILRIMDLAAAGSGNTIIARTIESIKASINEGKGIAEPMKVSKMFPAMVVQMVSVGEATGKLDELLLHVSDYYDSQVDYTISNMASLIEPILIVILGSAVLFMALGIFLPMWNLMSLFRR